MAGTPIPSPQNTKYMALYDNNGGAEYKLLGTVDANNNFLPVNLSATGLTTTTAGVTGVGDNLFVSAAELADLITLQPLATYEAVLAALGARTGADSVLATAASVDLNTATASTIYTVATGKSCIVSKFVVRLASTSLTTVSFSIGYNSTSFNDVLADATHVELTGATLYTILVPAVGAKIGTTGQALKLKCNTLQGAAATCSVDVYGRLY